MTRETNRDAAAAAGGDTGDAALSRLPPQHRFEAGLGRNAANYVPLTPLSLLARTASVYPQRLAVVYGSRRFTWAETEVRCRRLAASLARHGVGPGDTVAVMLANTPEMVEAHFGIAMARAVLNTLNTRLDAETIAVMLEHGAARVLITDREFAPMVARALTLVATPPLVIDVDDPAYDGPGARLGAFEYEAFLAAGDPAFAVRMPADEWDAISLNYTSGTTGNPKGVVYHHRGAYLNAVCNALDWPLPLHAVYLWTLPMFHCNGWCFPWSVAAVAGTNVCLRRIEPAAIFALMREQRVTHYCGAPVVHGALLHAASLEDPGLAHEVAALVAGAAPPGALIEGMERLGIALTHVYGLTETYGPAAVCAPQPQWRELAPAQRAERLGRQGVRYLLQEGMTVLDPLTLQPVPADGTTMGEVMFRGNITMKGYLANPQATAEAFAGGWFHSGDLGVLHPDGYLKIKDRSKDIIISGGENISSLEVEEVLHRHPAVLACAVVAKPDPKWGETPCAFVELKSGAEVSARELIAHCRTLLAHYKTPREIVFCVLPKTSTGKIQKAELRARLKSAAAIDAQ